MVTYIYALVDPRDDQVRYVGKSDKPRTRCRQHIRAARMGVQLPVYDWIRELLDEGLEPHQEVLEETLVNEWPEAERHWIAHFRALGADLTNVTDSVARFIAYLTGRGYTVTRGEVAA